MSSTDERQSLGSRRYRVSQPLRTDRCQNILYKTVLEHFKGLPPIAALLLASKSFQNSSFGVDLLLSFIVDESIIPLFKNVLSPSSCLTLQFVSSLQIKNAKENSCEEVNLDVANFVQELVNVKHLPLHLRSLTLERLPKQIVRAFVKVPNNTWPQLQSLVLFGCILDETVMELIAKSAARVTSLSLRTSLGVTDIGFERLGKSINLSSLDIAGCPDVNDTALQTISSSLNGITHLDLSFSRKISDGGLQHVAKLANITSLQMVFCDRITDVGLQHVSKLSRITSLDISCCNRITNVGLRNLSRLSRMAELRVSGCVSIDDEGMEHIAKFSNATSLDFSSCNRITNAGLEAGVAKLGSIAILNLSRCDLITDAGLQHVSKLSRMTSLNLSWIGRMTDVGLEHISKLSNLVLLDCDHSCSAITDVGLAHILTKCTNIETLVLRNNGSNITDAGLAHISNLAKITSLSLSGCNKITDVSLEHISKLSRLSHLDLCSCENISDVGIRAISKVSTITSLRIGCCEKITDLGLRLVARLPNLKHLFIMGCELMTDTCKEKFVTVFPNCEVVQ